MSIGAAAIAGGAALLGSAISARSQSKTNDKSIELAEKEFAYNKEMWNMNNAYNHPIQQMSRLKSAGLNPHLVYGNGAVGNTSSQTPQYKAPSLKAYTGFGEDFRSGAMNAMNAMNIVEQNKNLQEQNKVLSSTAELNLKKSVHQDILNRISGVDAGIKERTITDIENKIRNQSLQSSSDLEFSQMQVKLAEVERRAKEQNIKLTERQIRQVEQVIQIDALKIPQEKKRAIYSEIGINENDNMIFRMLGIFGTKAYNYFKSVPSSSGKPKPMYVYDSDGRLTRTIK